MDLYLRYCLNGNNKSEIMVGMTIPSFPSQDLAKLVLGYLAEEQLMTAYDEFLQASPYLDALQNEYDRIFMTSLKSILAEYRAVKIYVETCKPFALRRKLCQCANLLEVVKYLINHIDINKIINQDNNATKFSSDKSHSTTATTGTKTDCEICSLMKIQECVCKPKQTEMHVTGTQSISDVIPCQEVETTSLSDLPGNHVTTRKKYIKVLDKDASTSLFNSSCEQQETSSNNSTCVLKHMSSSSSNSCTMSTTIENPNVAMKTTESLESQQKIQEFNDVLKLVCNKNTHNINIQQDNIERRSSTAGTFQDFSTGVTGSDNTNVIVPDSSTCENIHVKVPVTKEASPSNNAGSDKRGPKTQYLLKVANDNDNSDSSSHVSDVIEVDSMNGNQLPRIIPKPIKSKVTILSNVKVDNEAITSNLKMPAVLKNATSTPITKMQTILINGTPVYRPTHPMISSRYTSDEIMAMPTIIITPVSGPPPLITTQRTQYTCSQSNVTPVIADVPPKSLEPLLIDVSSSITLTTEKSNLPLQSQQHDIANEASLIKTVDMVEVNKNINNETVTSASVPKDNVIPGCTVTSTPQVIPTARKSSSTPRRTSHVRVLDFATPRRILHEKIDECVTQQGTVAEVNISKSPSNAIQNVASSVTPVVGVNNESLAVTTSTCKEMDKSKSVGKRNKNWDADLRALIVGVQDDTQYDTPKSKSNCKPKSKKNKKKESSLQNKSTDDKKTLKKKPKSKKKKSRSPEKTVEDTKSIHELVDIQNNERTVIKPTINIVSRNEKEKCNQETKKVQNKSNSEEHDTPEGDRMSLPNVIGARLNISDLLETPYKQALYDIQMETPKFLGDLPDDPMSDIKIMNIPTPLFLNSSKGTQATPSSYCSRPTDYSSGGSYYKPDDQDYLPLSEHMDCPETLSKETQNIESQIGNDNETVVNNDNSNRLRPSRPVRQCTKNVSYYNNTNLHIKDKTKDIDENFEEDSSFCDSVSSLPEKKTNKENISKVLKENTPKTKPKSDKGRKINSKHYKSPVKKDASKSFMKIKPRRSTPVKCVKNERTKRKSSEFSLGVKSKCSPRKRTTSKERNAHSTPAVTVVPTKSRRKSSTPRKLHCTKTFNSESSGHNSPDIASKGKPNAPQESHLLCVLDSDTEQLPLRWSDDGSQDARNKEQQEITANESEDITKIQEYIKTTVSKTNIETEGSLHIDLVKRGFDVETAKIIERDLLDTPPYTKQDSIFISKSVEKMETEKADTLLNKTVESESSFSNNLQIVQDEVEADEDEVEFGNFESNEDSANYFTCQHDDTKMTPEIELVKLKDKFCMEVCIDDDVTVRLRATPFNMTLDIHPQMEDVIEYNQKEIEAAVRTISGINTPLKDSIKAQCFEIFDSTLTSLDTPLKATSPKKKEHTVTVTKIVLEVEKLDVKEKSDSKKRKRIRSGNTSDESVNDTKKVKSDAQYLFNSANIQNIDIESVLSKLHGP